MLNAHGIDLRKPSADQRPSNTHDPRTAAAAILASLVNKGLLSETDVDGLTKEAHSPTALEPILTGRFRLDPSSVGRELGAYYGCPYVPYDDGVIVDGDLLKDLSLDYLRKSGWLPLMRAGTVVHILTN